MENHLTLKTDSKHHNSSKKLKEILSGFFRRKPKDTSYRFGRTLGVVWETQCSHLEEDRMASIVEIKKGEIEVRVTIYDCHDPFAGGSVTNLFENIASGVYLAHLAKDHSPDQVCFFHHHALFGSEPDWGTSRVSLSWNKKRQCFENPSWGQRKKTYEVPQEDLWFIRDLRNKAAVAIEKHIREKHEKGDVMTPHEAGLYERYCEHISGKSEKYRYNLRGGWIFAKPKID